MKATICVPDDGTLKKCFAPEETEIKAGRASYTLSSTDTTLTFNIDASDSVSLRTTLNAITKLLTVHEKATALKNGSTKIN